MSRRAAAGFGDLLHPPQKQDGHGDKTTVCGPRHLRSLRTLKVLVGEKKKRKRKKKASGRKDELERKKEALIWTRRAPASADDPLVERCTRRQRPFIPVRACAGEAPSAKSVFPPASAAGFIPAGCRW